MKPLALYRSIATQACRLRGFSWTPLRKAGVLAVLSAVLVGEGAAWYAIRTSAEASSQAELRLTNELVRVQKLPAPLASRTFVAELPLTTSVDSLVRVLRTEASKSDVFFVSGAGGVKAATRISLARLEFKAILRGDYPKLKEVLGKTLEAVPGLQVEHLVLSKAPPSSIEARVDLVVLFRTPEAKAKGSTP